MTLQTDTQRGPRVLTASALAAELGLGRRWVYQAVEEHALPAFRVGRTLLFDLDAVEQWLQAHRIGSWSEPCSESPEADGI